MLERRRYLKKTPLREARERFLRTVDPGALEGETIRVGDALDRVTIAPVFAKNSVPHYHGSAMDGICLRAEDSFGATEFAPRRLTLLVDETRPEGCFSYLDTGNALPGWANAVVMIENVRQIDGTTVEIDEAAVPWQNVRLVGEDVAATELLLPRNHRLRPYDLGALIAAGHMTIAVKAKPRVALIPTGSEIVAAGSDAQPGRIVDFNSVLLASLITEWGGMPVTMPSVPDDASMLREALHTALADNHVVAIIAGSSAGRYDFTAPLVDEEGDLLVHGIDVMPGKPAVLGAVRGKPVIGVPGYPVSAIVIAREILRPAVEKLLGAGHAPEPTTRARVGRKIASRLGLEEFVRVSLGRVGDDLIAVPLGRGAGVITTMVRADGLLRIPTLAEGINAGEEVEVELLRAQEEVEHTILCTGSHDLSIGVLEDQLKRRHQELKIAATNVGSLGGLFAIRRGEAHIAGTHLLDPETGVYNVPDIERVIPDADVVLVHLAKREQGLLLPPGNPRSVSALRDVANRKLRFVNRQAGSGTRVLLDFELARLGLTGRDVRGYEHEEFTHLAVAVAVASGLADTGLGVRSAAEALGLDFLPIGEEQYDLLFNRPFFHSAKGQLLLEAIRSDEFRQAIEALGGYDAGASGEIVYEQKKDHGTQERPPTTGHRAQT